MGPYHTAVALVATVWLWLLLALATSAPVAIVVEGGTVKSEPAYVRLRVRVDPAPANRLLTVSIVSDGFSRASDEQLEGDRSPRSRWVEYHDVPAGSYMAHAMVDGAERRRASAPFVVVGRE